MYSTNNMDLRWFIDLEMERGCEQAAKGQHTAAFATFKKALRMVYQVLDDDVAPRVLTHLSLMKEDLIKKCDEMQEEISKRKQSGEFHERYEIKNFSWGNGYKSLLGRFLDDVIEFVVIQDPNIGDEEECYNLVRLCELLTQSCESLKFIEVITKKRISFGQEQQLCFDWLKSDLLQRKVKLYVKYYKNMTEQKISLSSGWVIKSSRGINIYKFLPDVLAFGQCDLELRQCEETTVDIYFSTTVETFHRADD